MKNIPRIRITYSWLLRHGPSQVLFDKSDHADKGKKLFSDEQYEEWAEDYRQAWKPKSKKILSAMQDVVDLKFKNPSIEVTLAPMFHPISQPLIIGFYSKPDEFIDVLTHELFHVLYTDNNKFSSRDTADRLGDFKWKELFGEEHSQKTLIHIPVHAGLKYIYLDVLKEPSRLERDIMWCKQLPDYSKAWDYVEKNDYKKILEKLKESYNNL